MRVFNCLVIAINASFACYMIADGNSTAAAISGGATALSLLITYGWPR